MMEHTRIVSLGVHVVVCMSLLFNYFSDRVLAPLPRRSGIQHASFRDIMGDVVGEQTGAGSLLDLHVDLQLHRVEFKTEKQRATSRSTSREGSFRLQSLRVELTFDLEGAHHLLQSGTHVDQQCMFLTMQPCWVAYCAAAPRRIREQWGQGEL